MLASDASLSLSLRSKFSNPVQYLRIMASITSSPSNSQNSTTKPRAPFSPSHQPQDAATGNGLPDALEKKTPAVDPFEDMDNGDYIKKFSKYEADYTRRLMAKYFSDKDIYGDNIFDESKTIDGETIKASRWHCAQSYADPVQFLKQKSNCTSVTSADTPATISNGKHPMEDG